MSNAFNPFAQAASASAQPSQPAQAPARTQAVPSSMNDPSLFDGFSTPYFRHIEGEFDLEITGYSGTTSAQTPNLGRGCHISFRVLTSSKADIPVGSEWRISYKYNWEHQEKSDKDTYGADMRKLADFVHALFRQPKGSGFDARAAERQLHTHDWKTQPGRVHLSASMGKPKPPKGVAPGTAGVALQAFRNDTWLPPAG